MSDDQISGPKAKKTAKSLVIFLLVMAAFVAGYYLSEHVRTADVAAPGKTVVGPEHPSNSEPHPEEKSSARPNLWTCAMHPQIKLPKPGKCPICGMDLIPLVVTAAEEESGASVLTMSESAKGLAEVETTVVKREPAYVKLRMVGLVFEDETRIASLTSRVDGRLDEVFVDFTGVKVNKGDPMVTIWSPTLIRSQVELFETIRSTEFDESVVKGAEEKLKQYGLTDAQIEHIRKNKKPSLYITLRAPISGVVMKKHVVLGDFVKEGTVMYEISDLSKVWVKLDAYETDLPWIRYGQNVTFTSPALPGRTFQGTIVFIDPMLSMQTRTVKVRVEADNPDYALKPHMFVNATIDVEVDHKGRVIKSEWAGKYICPIYPDQVFSEPGICPKSGMPLRTPEEFGYAPDKDAIQPLVIPETAVLFTGKRSIVYVEVPGRDRPTYEMRHVVLGPRASDQYVVYEGLVEGERVVTKGNFKIDSASQILAKESMMTPAAAPPSDRQVMLLEQEISEQPIEASADFGKALDPLFDEYVMLKNALVEESPSRAGTHARRLTDELHEVNVDRLAKKTRDFWYRSSGKMFIDLLNIAKTEDVRAQRLSFRKVSETLATAVLGFRDAIESRVYIYRCPTVFDNTGAFWIEKTKEFSNPYLGKERTTCGDLIAAIPPEKTTPMKHMPGEATDAHGATAHPSAGEPESKPPTPSKEMGSATKEQHSRGEASDTKQALPHKGGSDAMRPGTPMKGSGSRDPHGAVQGGTSKPHAAPSHDSGSTKHLPSKEESVTRKHGSAGGSQTRPDTRMQGSGSK